MRKIFITLLFVIFTQLAFAQNNQAKEEYCIVFTNMSKMTTWDIVITKGGISTVVESVKIDLKDPHILVTAWLKNVDKLAAEGWTVVNATDKMIFMKRTL